jgi:mono/diheme cytochrome c family protein
MALRGFVRVEKSGSYEFSTRSDDGSMLYVDGKPVVANDGEHAPAEASGAVWLERGLHGLLVNYFEAAGGEELSIRWQPPGADKQVIPPGALSHSSVRFTPPAARFAADARQVVRGRAAFAELGCAACHPLPGLPAPKLATRPFADLPGHVERGCLSEIPDPRAPRFDLEPAERASLRAIAGDLGARALPRTPADELDLTLTRLDCRACHSRNGTGGPREDKLGYFQAAVEVDLGNEGRLPPRLDAVGSKLYAAWMTKVLVEGAVERPYIATRMPQYGSSNVGHLGAAFEAVDGSPKDLEAPPFSAEHAEIGRKLAGSGGLVCIQCHVFDGVRSLGIPAVDLAHVRERIKPAWFERLLLDPKSLGMNTRMPIFWDAQGVSAARTLLDGDPKRQAAALWNYVSLGHSMPLPEGLVVPDSEFELTPTTETILCGVFMKNTSPRTLLVGNPELVHYAFDLENSRLVCAWRGRFFNARGTWEGRAGGLEWPKSDDLVEFARAPALAHLERADAAWPSEIGRAAGFKRLGTRYDARRRPTFRYQLGEIEIAESCAVLVRSGPPGLTRCFELRAARPVDDLYLRADPAAPERKHVSFSRAADGGYVAHVEAEVTW